MPSYGYLQYLNVHVAGHSAGWIIHLTTKVSAQCTCMTATVFKEFKDKFWFFSTFKDIKIFQGI